MLFRSTVFAALAACAFATSLPRKAALRKPEDAMIPDFNIATDSTIGKRLLSKARRLENNNNNNDQEADWLAGYSIKYESCASLIQVREEGGGDDEGILYNQNLVKFIVCPGTGNGQGNCNDCGSGVAQYVVNMMEFVQAYTEMKQEEQEQACETIAEYCYCDNANDDEVCENQCYADAGMDGCIEYEGQEEFEIDGYLECQGKRNIVWCILLLQRATYSTKDGIVVAKQAVFFFYIVVGLVYSSLFGFSRFLLKPFIITEMEGGNDNNNNNNGNYNGNYNSNSNGGGVDMYRQYWIGPVCSPSDGQSIYLAAFYDAGCTSYAGTGVYEAFNYGYALPYESEPIVALNDCISCLQVDQDNDNNNNYNNNGDDNNNNNNSKFHFKVSATTSTSLLPTVHHTRASLVAIFSQS